MDTALMLKSSTYVIALIGEIRSIHGSEITEYEDIESYTKAHPDMPRNLNNWYVRRGIASRLYNSPIGLKLEQITLVRPDLFIEDMFKRDLILKRLDY